MSNSLRPDRLYPARLLCPWDSSGKNNGMGCHFFLQGIFPTQGLNLHLLCLLHWQVGSLPLGPPGKPLLMTIDYSYWASQVAPVMSIQETWVQSLGWEDPLDKEMATHSNTLAWKIPRTEEPGRLQSLELQRVRHD